MGVTIAQVRYGAGREFSGYLAYPERATTPLPAIVVIHEAWGLDDHTEDVTRRFALAGYAAFAPDVFARDGERLPLFTRERAAENKAFFGELKPDQAMDAAKRDAALDAKPEPFRSRLRESLQAMFAQIGKIEDNLAPVLAAAKHLREECAITQGQRIGSVGFCMGGGLSALLACRDPELAAAVVCYGFAPAEDELAKLRCSVLGLYGALDGRINAGLPAFVEAMKKHGKSLEHHVYEGAGHAFFNDTRQSYDVGAARHAFARMLSFFESNLAP